MTPEPSSPMLFQGNLLILWQRAQDDFLNQVKANGAEIPEKALLEDPNKWAEALKGESSKSEDNATFKVVGRHVKEIQQALNGLNGLFQILSGAFPVLSPVTLVLQAFASVFQFWVKAKEKLEKLSGFFKEIGGLFKDISSLNNVLQSGFLSNGLQKDDRLDNLRERLLEIFSSSLKICGIAIQEQRGRFKKWIQAQFNGDSELDSALEDLKNAKDRLRYSVSLQTFSCSVAALDGVEVLKDRLSESDRSELLIWLSPSTFHDRHEKLLEDTKGRPNAGKWLLDSQEFKNWTVTDGSRLWYTGKPGAGKSVLASIVIRHLRQFSNTTSDSPVLMFLYMNHAQDRKLRELLGLMLRQVVEEITDVPLELEQEWKRQAKRGKDSRGEYTVKPEEGFLLSQLSTITANRPLYIVLDAMDECAYDSRRDVMDSIQRINKRASILVTARLLEDGAELSKGFRPLRIEAHDSDIEEFVDWEISHSRVLRGTNQATSIKETVRRKAGGMFLLAKLHVSALKDIGFTDSDISDALVKLPTTVDESYRQTLKRINKKSTHRQKFAHRILGWLSHVYGVLSVDELSHAIAVQMKGQNFNPQNFEINRPLTKDDLESFCCGLVEVSTDNTLRFVHYSAENYFKQRKDDTFGDFLREIPLVCAKYLCIEELSNKYYHWNKREFFPLFPFAKYAAGYLHHHFRSVRQLQKDEDLFRYVSQLVDKIVYYHLLCELEAYYTFSEALESRRRYRSSEDEDSTRVPSMHLAVFLGCPGLVKSLIDREISLTVLDGFGQNPLTIAFKRDFGDIAGLLLDGGATVDLSTRKGHTLILYAAQKNFNQAVEKILEGIPKSEPMPSFLDFITFALSPFLVALWLLRGIIGWLSSSSSPTLKVIVGWFRLFSDFTDRAIAESLRSPVKIEKQSRENRESDRLQNLFNTYGLLLRLAYYGEGDELKAFLDRYWIDRTLSEPQFEQQSGADSEKELSSEDEQVFSQESGDDSSSEYGHEWSERSWEETSGLTDQDYLDTACLLAIERGHKQSVEFLLDAGVRIDLRNSGSCGQSLLHRATFRNNMDLVKLLIRRHADVNAEDDRHRTPFTANPYISHADVLNYLKEHGSDINHRGNSGVHELYRAAAFGNNDMVKFFLNHGVDPSIQNRFSWTPIHEAAANAHLDCVKLLVDQGADVSPISDVGKTPLDLINSGKTHYDWPCLGEDSEHYLNGQAYREEQFDLEALDRLEVIKGILLAKGAKTADQRYAENKKDFRHVMAGPYSHGWD